MYGARGQHTHYTDDVDGRAHVIMQPHQDCRSRHRPGLGCRNVHVPLRTRAYDLLTHSSDVHVPRDHLLPLSSGALAEFVRIKGKFAIPIPDAIQTEHTGPLMCAGVTVVAVCRRHNIRAGERIGVLGLGGLVISLFKSRINGQSCMRMRSHLARPALPAL
jgi:D-arabinose 1-dehydrogenase-like Zn-dependent alcohol dehydrogenase